VSKPPTPAMEASGYSPRSAVQLPLPRLGVWRKIYSLEMIESKIKEGVVEESGARVKEQRPNIEHKGRRRVG
jgi:hypothetical protein